MREITDKAKSVTVAAIEANVIALTEAFTLVERFHSMIRMKVEADLDAWLTDAGTSLLAPSRPGSPRARPPSAPR